MVPIVKIGSVMKRTKTSLPYSPRRQTHGADSEDRISDLPEPILGHILSNLPIQNAVATGVLSKRWRFFWTTTGNLDFRFQGGSVEQFVQSVNYVMPLHKPAGYFNRFSLTWKPECIPFHVNTWICTAVSRNVHVLIVDVDYGYKLPLHVQSYLFSSEKLMSLKLHCIICFSPEIVVSLPRLERLKLNSVSFQSEEAFSKLIDGCPVLKRLFIRIDNRNSIAFNCKISSTSLKHLTLRTSVVFSPFLGVELDAPSLEHLTLIRISSIFLQQRHNFLRKVIFSPASLGQKTRDPNYCNSIVGTLHALSCAEALTFYSVVIRALSCATIKLETRFNRLMSLMVERGQNCWSAIQILIELSAKLEFLAIFKLASDDNDNEESQFNNSNWTNPSVVPACLSNSLKIVLFVGYDGHPDVLTMIEYIIKHGSVLELMQIRFDETFSSLNRKDELIQLISTFPRKSTICEVEFRDSAHSAVDA